MTNPNPHIDPSVGLTPTSTSQVGFYAAILTTIITIVTFGLAITALPNSGASCLADCVEYPYLDTLAEFPRDYLWMLPAILLVLSYTILMTAIHSYTPLQNKVFSQIGLSFTIITAVVLLIVYFIQFSVVPVSLMSGETEGMALITQYNPHGIFIVLEELGYLMMSLSFFFAALGFPGKSRIASAVRWVFVAGFALALVSLVSFSLIYGLERQYRFEIAVISIDWLVLIVNGILLSILFRRQGGVQ
jgi:hypothetical protein